MDGQGISIFTSVTDTKMVVVVDHLDVVITIAVHVPTRMKDLKGDLKEEIETVITAGLVLPCPAERGMQIEDR